ncbi:MAG TPA: hypothetical protein VHN74_12905 [Candidatus Angelobacter sp.]|jgi:hypothetical protein|nr:hypothetical protein [Candidatus Angelobacter sp.]
MNKRTIIYKNVKSGSYLVQSYTMGPVAASEFGEPTAIQSNEFSTRLADAVIQSLERFGKEPYDKNGAVIRDDKEQREFLADHLGVSVSQQESGELKVYALHREGGGMVSSQQDTFILSKEEIPRKLSATIAEAFRRAT